MSSSERIRTYINRSNIIKLKKFFKDLSDLNSETEPLFSIHGDNGLIFSSCDNKSKLKLIRSKMADLFFDKQFYSVDAFLSFFNSVNTVEKKTKSPVILIEFSVFNVENKLEKDCYLVTLLTAKSQKIIEPYMMRSW